MPKKVILEDGMEIEVPSDEELKTLHEKAQKVEEAEKAKTAAEAKIKELEEGVNPNWPDIRKQLADKKALEEQLKAQGKKIDADGKIVDENPPAISVEDIAKTAGAAARKEIMNSHKEILLRQFSADERKAIEFYFEKFSAGEELTIEKIDKFIADAEVLVRPTQKIDPKLNLSGGVPHTQNLNQPSADALEFAKLLGNSPEDLAHADDPLIKIN